VYCNGYKYIYSSAALNFKQKKGSAKEGTSYPLGSFHLKGANIHFDEQQPMGPQLAITRGG